MFDHLLVFYKKKSIFHPLAKYDLVLGEETVFDKYSSQTFYEVDYQVFTDPWVGILAHSSLHILSKSLRLVGYRSATWIFSFLHRFSKGLMSGDWHGHSIVLMCFFLSHSFVTFGIWFESLSSWNTYPRSIFNVLVEARRFSLKISLYL